MDATDDRTDAETALDVLQEATRRLLRTVDELTAGELDQPSLLPGWTRRHVVAHLALNAEGLARALRGIADGEVVPMYDSDEARDTDIEELARAEPAELRERLLAATTRFAEAVEALDSGADAATVLRTHGGPTFPATTALAKRHREVEIHHADLDAGYTRADWPTAFSVLVVDDFSRRLGKSGIDATLRASDADRNWEVGGGGEPTIIGPAADLAWWVTGRGEGEGLTSSSGSLPEVPAW